MSPDGGPTAQTRGHTAGSIAPWDPAGGVLFTGDTAALDDPLHAEDEEAFLASLVRLRKLPGSGCQPIVMRTAA
jgi:glyoxylase-like metal-dependent hydrolase (beta-lactamase superfamily II)